ncbi:unnamed protein product [Fraxinus pennsylvanica]|uniref:Uncharacterized protein n=1 Tax=Fraxinus pennsylvanica TaxID=56036 RepID=A0AAD2AM89_9LAMI|nr:unnamed protein product [Fraxinus pennsylvanica]
MRVKLSGVQSIAAAARLTHLPPASRQFMLRCSNLLVPDPIATLMMILPVLSPAMVQIILLERFRITIPPTMNPTSIILVNTPSSCHKQAEGKKQQHIGTQSDSGQDKLPETALPQKADCELNTAKGQQENSSPQLHEGETSEKGNNQSDQVEEQTEKTTGATENGGQINLVSDCNAKQKTKSTVQAKKTTKKASKRGNTLAILS